MAKALATAELGLAQEPSAAEFMAPAKAGPRNKIVDGVHVIGGSEAASGTGDRESREGTHGCGANPDEASANRTPDDLANTQINPKNKTAVFSYQLVS